MGQTPSREGFGGLEKIFRVSGTISTDLDAEKRADVRQPFCLSEAVCRKQDPGFVRFYDFTFMLFTTDFTPSIWLATRTALSASAWLSTSPLKVTTPS